MEGLYRSQKNRIIGGVAGGLGEYFGVDVVLVRLLWVLAIFLGGGGLFVYVIAWIIIPDETQAFTGPVRRTERRGRPAGTMQAEREAGEEGEKADYNGETHASAAAQQAGGAAGREHAWQDTGTQRRRNAGLILIGLGIIFLIYQVFGPFIRFGWPLILVILGFYLLIRERKEGER